MTQSTTALLLAAADAAQIGYAIVNRAGQVIEVSPAFERHTGLTPAPEGAPWYERDNAPEVLKEQRGRLWQRLVTRRQRPWRGMVHWHLPTGRRRYFEGTVVPDTADRYVLVTNDATARIRARRSLRRTEDRYHKLLDDLPIAICVGDEQGRLTYCNTYLPKRLGIDRSEALGLTLDELIGCPDSLRKAAQSTDTADGIVCTPTTGPLANTSWVFVRTLIPSVDGKSFDPLTIALDRTESHRLRDERDRLTASIHESQKISALNDFAGNLAHELSNILHPAGVYARRLAATPDVEAHKDYATRINHAVLTAGRLLRRTLSLARMTSDDATRTDIGTVAAETVGAAQDLAARGLTYVLDAPPGPLYARLRETELRQVLLNLLNNAAEATHYEGTVTARIEKIAVGHPLSSDSALRLTIEDQGEGISDELKDRIFEPFFTTKATGRGTGLGLAVVKALVTGWGGKIEVDTDQIGKTAFHVWLAEEAVKS